MRARVRVVGVGVLVLFTAAQGAYAFYEDLCLPRRNAQADPHDRSVCWKPLP